MQRNASESAAWVLGSGPVADGVAQLLRLAGPGDVTVLDWAAAERQSQLPEVAVAAPAPAELPELEGWNRRAFESHLPWLQVLPFDGRIAAVGPLFVPGEGPCYECYRLRREANLELGGTDNYWALERSPAPYPSSPALQHLVSGLAATLALRWLEGPEQPVRLHAIEWGASVQVSRHHVYRVPLCPVCAAESGRDRTAAPAGQSGLARLETLVSPYTGLVHRVREAARAPDDARMTRVACQVASRAATVGSPFPISAGGADYDRDAALGAALGEAIERYCGTCLPPPSQVELTTASAIGSKAVAPERFTLFSNVQYGSEGFPFEPFTAGTPVRWVKGWSIPDGAEAWVPLRLAYITTPGTSVAGEAEIAHGSSSGMALARTRDEAVLGGLLELIERDSVMLTWANRLVLPRLDWSSDPDLVEREGRHFIPTGLHYELIDLSAFFELPTVLGLIPGTGGDPVLFGIGAASAPTIQQAWDKTLRECFQTRTALKDDLSEQPLPSFRPDFSDVETPVDHVYFYARPENQVHLGFLDSSEQTRDVGDVPALEGEVPALIEQIARRLESRGASAYAVDVTAPDVAEAGLHVVHVISPELQPIDFPYRQRYLGGRRLYEAAYEAGLRDAPLAPDELNPHPHPFP